MSIDKSRYRLFRNAKTITTLHNQRPSRSARRDPGPSSAHSPRPDCEPGFTAWSWTNSVPENSWTGRRLRPLQGAAFVCQFGQQLVFLRLADVRSASAWCPTPWSSPTAASASMGTALSRDHSPAHRMLTAAVTQFGNNEASAIRLGEFTLVGPADDASPLAAVEGKRAVDAQTANARPICRHTELFRRPTWSRRESHRFVTPCVLSP